MGQAQPAAGSAPVPRVFATLNESSDPAPSTGLSSSRTEGARLPLDPEFSPGLGAVDVPVPCCEITLQNPCAYPEAGARRIRPWLTPVVTGLAPAARELTVRFVSDREMRRLSADYRGKDRTTDVLTFMGDYPPPEDRGFRAATPSPEDSGDDGFPVMAEAGCAEGDGESFPVGGFLGDVVISVPTARRQASERGHSVERELRILLLHGLLHCLGYDHEVDDGTMERKEDELRRRLGIEPGDAS